MDPSGIPRYGSYRHVVRERPTRGWRRRWHSRWSLRGGSCFDPIHIRLILTLKPLDLFIELAVADDESFMLISSLAKYAN
jgi:hypothetical protein